MLLADPFILSTKDANHDDDDSEVCSSSSSDEESMSSVISSFDENDASKKRNLEEDDKVKVDVKMKTEKKPIMIHVKSEKEITKIELNLAELHANEALAELTQFKKTECAISDTIRKWHAEGVTLKEAVARGKRVASGLAHSHRKHVLDSEHRDIMMSKRHRKEEVEKMQC